MLSISALTRIPPTEWYLHYNAIDSLLEDYIANYYEHNVWRRERKTFVAFLVQAQVKLPHLSETSLRLLFNVIMDTVPTTISPSNLKPAYHALVLMLRANFQMSESHRIMKLLSQCANQLSKVTHLSNTSQSRNLLWVIVANYDKYGHYQGEDLPKYLESLQQLQTRFLTFGQPDLFWHQATLLVWRRLRAIHPSLKPNIDQFVKDYITQAIDSLNNDSLVAQLKEMVYLEYVQFLANREDFIHMYTTVSENRVFPFTTNLILGPAIDVTFRSQQFISLDKMQIMNATLWTAYTQMEEFKTSMDMPVYQIDVSKSAFSFYLFDNQTEYMRLGMLFNIRRDNGGYMQVHHTSTSHPWYRAFVYKELDEPYRNLGHEFVHMLTYAWLTPKAAIGQPVWFSEGMASSLGQTNCNRDEMDYLTHLFQENTHTIRSVTHLELIDGLDMYYFGTMLFKYLSSEHHGRLKEAIQHLQATRVGTDTFNTWIADTMPDGFQSWLSNYQDLCRSQQSHIEKQKKTAKLHLETRETKRRQREQLEQLRSAILNGTRAERETLLNHMNFHEIDINTRFEHNNTLLHYAVNASDLGTTWALLHKGANLTALNQDKVSPADLALGHYEMLYYISGYLRHRASSTTTPSAAGDSETISVDQEGAQFTSSSTLPRKIETTTPLISLTELTSQTDPDQISSDESRDLKEFMVDVNDFYNETIDPSPNFTANRDLIWTPPTTGNTTNSNISGEHSSISWVPIIVIPIFLLLLCMFIILRCYMARSNRAASQPKDTLKETNYVPVPVSETHIIL